MTEEEYESIEGYRSTEIKAAAKGSLYLHHYNTSEFNETPAMKLGTPAHKAILEPERYKEEVVVMPTFKPIKEPKTTKKAQEEKFLSDNIGRDIITESDSEKINGIMSAVKRDEWFFKKNLLLTENMETEKCLVWDDEGQPMKARIDILEKNYIGDIKITGVNLGKVYYNILDFGYHASMRHYQNGVMIKNNEDFRRPCYLIFIQNAAPFEIVVVKLSDEMLEAGQKILDKGIENIQNYDSEKLLGSSNGRIIGI